MDVGKEYRGKYENLHYYNNKNLEFMTSDKTAETGTVNLDFSHALDYVLVMSDAEGVQAGNADGNARKSVKTGDSTTTLPYVAALIVCAGICGAIIKKKYFVK